MSNKYRKSLVLILLIAGCGETANVGNDAEQATTSSVPQANSAKENPLLHQRVDQPPARELDFLRTYELEFIHDVLREKVERIDRLARGQGLPAENTVEWKLRPPSVNDNRKLHDFIAKWSSHDIGLYSLQPNERPGSEIFMMVGVDPANTKVIRSFSLSARSQCKREGWDARISLFSWRPYQREQVGDETLRFSLRRSEETAVVEYIEWPFKQSNATLPEPTEDPWGRNIVVFTEFPKLSLQQIQEALTSADSFRDWVRRELEAARIRLLDNIAAGRNAQIITLTYDTSNSIPTPIPTIPVSNDPPASFRLTSQQKRKLKETATSETNGRIALFSNEYKMMYAAIMQAFPIDKYFAKEGKSQLRANEGQP